MKDVFRKAVPMIMQKGINQSFLGYDICQYLPSINHESLPDPNKDLEVYFQFCHADKPPTTALSVSHLTRPQYRSCSTVKKNLQCVSLDFHSMIKKKHQQCYSNDFLYILSFEKDTEIY